MTQATDQKSSHWLRAELGGRQLFTSLTSGLLMGAVEVVFALSVGSLIFSGELSPYLSYGLGMALVTTTIFLIGISLGTSVPGVTGSSQDSSSVLLAVIAAALVGTLSTAGAEEMLATVLVAIAAATLLTGAFFLALGFLKLGKLVRFLPYPVVGGFLAGTGWLLVQGAFGVMADFPLTLANLPALLQPDALLLWVPGVLLALGLLLGLRRFNHFLTMPGILIGAILLFYLALLATGTSLDEASSRGLVLGGVSGQATWQPLTWNHLPAANWAAILGQGPNIAIILVLSAVGLLLNASGIELAIRRDVELNRELRVAGFANLISGLGGGMVGYQALDLSTLCCRIGARGRLPGLVAGAVCALMLAVGAPLLAYFPKPILGGILLFMGLGFLVDWVVDGWRKLPRADYAVVLLILIVIGVTNFLIGVAVGLVAMIVLFALNYSRIEVVRHALSGAELKSNVERCAYHRRVLGDLGQHTYVLELQGYIFFGTANALLERVRARVRDAGKPSVRYLILDFRRVTGLDSSAVISFVKGKQLAEGQGITLLLTGISDEIQRQFERGGLSGTEEGVRIFPDLDRGLEWCEDQFLETDLVTHLVLPVTLLAQLQDNGFEKANAARLLEFLEKVEVEAGETLIQQGESADDLYFIEMGGVSVYLEIEDGQKVRLRTSGPGTVVGELGLYLHAQRTASVIADYPTTAYQLSQAALLEMKGKEPELAAAFHEFVVRLVSERLASTLRLLEAVLG